jgi:hypothetical protein
MAALPAVSNDPTLVMLDRIMEERAVTAPRRSYLGMSSLGHPCGRKLWYDVRTTKQAHFDAATLRRFEDGHRGEALMATRLRMVPGVTLHTVDPNTGGQFGFSDFGGRLKGHMDGAILGILQAPKTWHCWEHKCVNDKKLGLLNKHKAELGEKSALAAWDEIYYSQAVLYMHYSGMDRHYMTVSSPGERTTISVRTNSDPVAALRLRAKAEQILESKFPLARVSNSPDWWQCKFCEHAPVCHV